MMNKIHLFLIFGLVTISQGSLSSTTDLDDNSEYNFSYRVNNPATGDIKDQHESKLGDEVRGSYSLIEPDGSKRTVDYKSDINGFNAVVQKITPAPAVELQESTGQTAKDHSSSFDAATEVTNTKEVSVLSEDTASSDKFFTPPESPIAIIAHPRFSYMLKPELFYSTATEYNYFNPYILKYY